MITHQYRLYTERQPEAVLLPVVSALFPGASLILAKGLWQGVAEDSVIIEILGTEADFGNILALKETIRVTFKQQAVLLTINPVEVYL